MTGVTAVAAGWSHTLALDSEGKVWAWGRNNYGQLGNNSTSNANAPVLVSTPDGVTFTAIAAGGYHSLALATGRHRLCLGAEYIRPVGHWAMPRVPECRKRQRSWD